MKRALVARLSALHPDLRVFIDELNRLDNKHGISARVFTHAAQAGLGDSFSLKAPEAPRLFAAIAGHGILYNTFTKAREKWLESQTTGEEQREALEKLFLEELGATNARDFLDPGKKSLLFQRGQTLANEILVKWLGSRL